MKQNKKVTHRNNIFYHSACDSLPLLFVFESQFPSLSFVYITYILPNFYSAPSSSFSDWVPVHRDQSALFSLHGSASLSESALSCIVETPLNSGCYSHVIPPNIQGTLGLTFGALLLLCPLNICGSAFSFTASDSSNTLQRWRFVPTCLFMRQCDTSHLVLLQILCQVFFILLSSSSSNFDMGTSRSSKPVPSYHFHYFLLKHKFPRMLS